MAQYEHTVHMQMYKGLASNGRSMPEGAIRHIYRWAKNNKDMGLLADLARREDLPPNILAELKNYEAAEVKAAYFHSNNVTAEELAEAAKKEKRAIVLAAIAHSTKTPTKTLETLADIGAPEVNLALIENVNTPQKVATKALRELWRTDTLGSRASAQLLDTLPHMSNIAALNLDAIPPSGYYLAPYSYVGEKIITSEDLTSEAETNIVKYFVTNPLTAKEDYDSRVYPAVALITYRPTLQLESIKLVEEALNNTQARKMIGVAALQELKDLAKLRVAKTTSETLKLLHLARKATSASEVQTLTAQALQQVEREGESITPELTATFDALSLNIHVNTATIIPMVPYVSGPHETASVTDQLVAKYEGNDAVLTEILDRYQIYLHPKILYKLSNPTAVIDELAKRSMLDTTKRDSEPLTRWRRFMLLGCLSEKGILHIPVQFLGDNDSWEVKEFEKSYELVETILRQRLGDNVDHWEIFFTLAEESDKTLGELLEMADILLEKR